MNFQITAGASSYLPKETVAKILDTMREKSVIYNMASRRGQVMEVENEKTLPVFSAFAAAQIYYTGSTSDITTLTEQSLTISTPDLAPQELGTYVYIPKKDAEVYAKLGLEEKINSNLAEAMGTAVDEIAVQGNTDLTSTNRLRIYNGLYTMANSADLCSETAVRYTAKTAAGVLAGVLAARAEIASYGSQDQTRNLVLFCSPTFISNAKTTAATTQIGFGIKDRPDLGLVDVVHIDGIPCVERQQLGTDIALLVNMAGVFFGYYNKIEGDMAYKIERNSYLLVARFWADMKWAYLDGSGKAVGLVKLSYAAS